jgi:hypothetical protein
MTMVKRGKMRLWPLVLAAALVAVLAPVLFRAGPAEAGWCDVSWLIVYVSPGNSGHVELGCPPGECLVGLEGYRLVPDPRASGPVPAVQPLPLGTEVNLSAVPAFGYRFDGWSGDITSDSREISAKLGQTTRLTANFSPLMPFWLIPIIAAAVAISLLLLLRRRRARRTLPESEPPKE